MKRTLTPVFATSNLYWLRELRRELEARSLGPYTSEELEQLREIVDDAEALVITMRV